MNVDLKLDVSPTDLGRSYLAFALLSYIVRKILLDSILGMESSSDSCVRHFLGLRLGHTSTINVTRRKRSGVPGRILVQTRRQNMLILVPILHCSGTLF